MDKKERKIGKRSPGYPMISLDEAIEKAKILWAKDKNNLIPYEAVYKHLGFKSQAGYAARVLAALKKFDLILEKQGSIMLTSDAIDLMLHSPDDERYIETIKKLALKPVIYGKLFNEFNGVIPSDATLTVTLIKEHKFNPVSVNDFIISFKRTLDFAGLTSIKEKREEKKEIEEKAKDQSGIGTLTHMATTTEQEKEKAGGKAGVVQSFLIPLSKGKKAAINFESLPLGEKDVDAIKKWLELFSESLTEKTEG